MEVKSLKFQLNCSRTGSREEGIYDDNNISPIISEALYEFLIETFPSTSFL
jgi:hypothetical protein